MVTRDILILIASLGIYCLILVILNNIFFGKKILYKFVYQKHNGWSNNNPLILLEEWKLTDLDFSSYVIYNSLSVNLNIEKYLYGIFHKNLKEGESIYVKVYTLEDNVFSDTDIKGKYMITNKKVYRLW